MALSTYADLVTALGRWRFEEGVAITSMAADFIQLAEARINNGDMTPQFSTPALRVHDMIDSETITLTDGSGDLPDDFLAVYRVVTDADSPRDLTYVTPSWYQEAHPSADTDESFHFYTRIGSTIRSKSASTLSLLYYAKIPALTSTDNENWLLTKDPRAYLYGSTLEASIYRGDQKRAIEMATLFKGVMESLQATDQYSNAGTFERRASGLTP